MALLLRSSSMRSTNRPQQDPMEDIPLLDLELPETKDTENMQVELQAFPLKKMETIF